MECCLEMTHVESDVMMGHILVTLNVHIWHGGHSPSVRSLYGTYDLIKGMPWGVYFESLLIAL